MKAKLIAMILSILFMGGTGAAVVQHNNANKNSEVVSVSEENSNLKEDSNAKEDNTSVKEAAPTSGNTVNTTNQDIVTNENINDKKVNNSENKASSEEKVQVKENITNKVNNSTQNGTSIVSEASKQETSKHETSQKEASKSEASKSEASKSKASKQEVSTKQNTESSDAFMAQVEQSIYNKVNEQRSANGLSTLSYNTTMQKYARIKSQDMGNNNYFDHKDLNGNLITAKMQNDGVSYRAWGENIAYISGVSDPEALASQFMTNWMNSPGHRANILSTNFSSIGVGVYKVGNRVYATQEFYK